MEKATACKESIVYRHLGLPYPGRLDQSHPGFLKLGTFLPEELGGEAIADVMEGYIELIEAALDSNAFLPENRHLFTNHNFIRLDAYLQAYKSFRGFSREAVAAEGLLRPESREVKRDLAERRNPFGALDGLGDRMKAALRRHFEQIDKATPATYTDFLQSSNLPVSRFFRQPLPLQIPEQELERHVLLTGNSGTGKSTLLRQLIRVCAGNKAASIVVLDPAGNLAREVAQSTGIDKDRLIYLDPTLATDCAPVINPLDVHDLSEGAVHIATEEIVSTFEELLKDGNGADLTLNMRALLYPCLTTLIHAGGRTFFDLQRFMLNDPDLVDEGKQSPHDAVRSFFQTAFSERKFEVTKLSLFTKLQSLLNSPVFSRMVARPRSSFDLETAINGGKIIVLSLAKGALGAETSEALGRFFIASLKGIVQKRWNDGGRHNPVFLVVDEVQNYVSPSIVEILRESRKYGLHLVASTQFISDMDRNIQDAFLSVTNVKITGKNAALTLSVMAKETGAQVECLQALKQGMFSVKVDTAMPVTVTVPPPESKHGADGNWADIVRQQLESYYLPLEQPASQSDEVEGQEEGPPEIHKARLEI